MNQLHFFDVCEGVTGTIATIAIHLGPVILVVNVVGIVAVPAEGIASELQRLC